jgi:hypothetical protein
MKVTIILPGRRLAGFQESADRFGVDFSHESADVLALPSQGLVFLDSPGVVQSFHQSFRKAQGLQVLRREFHERLAEFLKGPALPLEMALAGPVFCRGRFATLHETAPESIGASPEISRSTSSRVL